MEVTIASHMNVNIVRSYSLLCSFALLALCGCRSNTPSREAVSSGGPQPASAAYVDPATTGEIKGVVHFNGKAPERVKIDMTMDPACSLAGTNLSEPVVVSAGKLANVFVYVKSIAPSKAPNGTPPVVLDQKGCRFQPHVIAVQQGGEVEFRNSDPTMHNVHTLAESAGNKTLDISQAPLGQADTRRFDTPEIMLPIRCNNHPWMSAFLNVAPSPYFAVTGTDGSFTLRNVPAGAYTLAAVQEKLGEQDVQVTVPAKGSADASFTFLPK